MNNATWSGHGQELDQQQEQTQAQDNYSWHVQQMVICKAKPKPKAWLTAAVHCATNKLIFKDYIYIHTEKNIMI
ncbi:hypothetical protein ACLKA7_012486 [Drosophila subpalustris]